MVVDLLVFRVLLDLQEQLAQLAQLEQLEQLEQILLLLVQQDQPG